MSIILKNSQLNDDTITALNTLIDLDINAQAAFRLMRIIKELSSILDDKIKNCGFNSADFELIKGDISNTSFDFVAKRPGFKISLLYLDLDLKTPTYNVLSAFWDRVSRGGIVVFDEYAYHQWSESLGVDKFFEDKNIVVKTLDYNAPTAYVIKP
jgi:hypothetical protein